MPPEETNGKELEREANLKRVARAAAAEVLAMAGSAASQLAGTATDVARTLAETTRVDLEYIKKDLAEIRTDMKAMPGYINGKFVTAEMFDLRMKPLERLMYGLVTLILTGFGFGLLFLVFKR